MAEYSVVCFFVFGGKLPKSAVFVINVFCYYNSLLAICQTVL